VHDLSGQSHFHDRIRRVLLAASIEIQMTDKEARFLIGNISGGSAEAVVFDQPPILAALDRLMTAIEELGGAVPNPKPAGRRLPWMECPTCNRLGWDVNNHGDWQECPTCEGAGTIIIRSE
jgi:hypothetical protein